MKKLSIIMFAILLILPFMLVAEDNENAQQEQEPTSFDKYVEQPSTETFTAAWKEYTDALENEPDNPMNRIMLSYLHLMEMGRTLEWFEDNMDSLAPGAQFQYANMLLAVGQYDEAVEIYDVLNENTPKWSCPWRHKGEALMKSGKLEKAETALKMAIETRVEHYDAYVWLAEVQNEMGKYKEALETLETGLTYYGKDIEDPEEEVSNIDVSFLHLELLEKNQKTDEYKELETKLKKLAPNDPRWTK